MQPGLGDGAEDFTLVDRVDDGGQREDGGDENGEPEREPEGAVGAVVVAIVLVTLNLIFW